MSSLLVRDLEVMRGDRVIVAGLSLSLAPGEVLHLEGRNGAGKTSVLEVLCGFRRASAGRIEQAPAPEHRHWLGHRNALNLALSPLENLQFWAGLNGVTLADPEAAFERVGLRQQRHRACGRLSTGQKRRAALVRLVAVQRPWWFLDEPLAGLDREGLEIFGALLGAHVAAGGAALVTSHQPLPGAPAGLRSLSLSP
jgi:heme exporter protein A